MYQYRFDAISTPHTKEPCLLMHRPRLSAFTALARVLLFGALILSLVLPAQADNLPFPEPANENAYAVPVENLRLGV